MNSHCDRFEHFETAYGEIIFDRKTHTLLDDSGRFSSNNEIKTNDTILFSLFPQKFLAHIKIPSCIFVIFIIISSISFIAITILFNKWISLFSMANLWLMLLIEPSILLISVSLHELSHAIIAVSCGGFVAEIGIIKHKYGYQYYTRIFWMNVSRSKRLIFMLGGIAMNMFLSILGCFLLYKFQISIGFFIYVTNSILAVMNLFPQKSINSDGYQIATMLCRRSTVTKDGK